LNIEKTADFGEAEVEGEMEMEMFDNKMSMQPDTDHVDPDHVDPELVASLTDNIMKQSTGKKDSLKDKTFEGDSVGNKDESYKNNQTEGESNDSSKIFAEGESDASCKDKDSRPNTNRNFLR
jgi:hypothetical protein